MGRDFARRGHVGGCLLGLLGQELADRSPVARDVLKGLFERWQRRIADCLREARERGELGRHVECTTMAAFILDAWQGALLQMKLQRSGTPLEGFRTIVFDQLLRPGGGTGPS